jgi:NADH dehydrogenase
MSLRKLTGVCEVAMQSGLYAGRRVRHELEGTSTTRPFKYHDFGSAAYVARGRAVLSAGPVHLSGLPGWFAWLFIHIAFLTGFRNRIGALLTWWVAFVRDIRKERAYTTHAVGFVQDIYQPASSASTPGATGASTAPRPPEQRSAPQQPAAHRPGSS